MLLAETILAVSSGNIRRAECQVASCQGCDPTADQPFSRALAHLRIAPEDTDFFMCEPAYCPACGETILEHTLVELCWE